METATSEKSVSTTPLRNRRGTERIREESYLASDESNRLPLRLLGMVDIEWRTVHFVGETGEPLRDDLERMKQALFKEAQVRFPHLSTDYIFDFRFRCIRNERRRKPDEGSMETIFWIVGNAYNNGCI